MVTIPNHRAVQCVPDGGYVTSSRRGLLYRNMENVKSLRLSWVSLFESVTLIVHGSCA